MFSIEMKICGAIVAHISGINKGYTNGTEADKCFYDYEYYEVGPGAKEDKEGKLIRGNVIHGRSEGLYKLALVILKDVDKKNKH